MGFETEEEAASGTGTFLFAGGDFEQRLTAAAEIEQDLVSSPSPETRAAAAISALFQGRTDRAIAGLEAARLERPADARIVNDLSAAYLVRASREDLPLDLLTALGLALQAARLSPESPEPVFNVAFALDSLYLVIAAREAWRAYLEIDATDSSWSRFARDRLRQLEEPWATTRWHERQGELREAARARDLERIRELVEAFPELALREAEDWLLADWSRAVLENDEGAAKDVLDALGEVAAVLPANRGGRLLRMAGTRATANGDPGSRHRLARSYFELYEASAAIERFETEAAAQLLERSIGGLQGLNSPYLPRARLLLALCRYESLGYAEAEVLLDDVRISAREAGDLRSVIHSHQLSGVIAGIDNRLEASLVHRQEALDLAEELGWLGLAAASDGLMGEALGLLGDEESAWRYRLRAASRQGWVDRPRIRVRIWSELVRAVWNREPSIGRPFVQELVEAAGEADLPLTWAAALERRAGLLFRLGEQEAALADLDAADLWIDQLANPALIDAMRGDVLLSRADILTSTDPQRAASLADRATDVFGRTAYDEGLFRALQIRARNHRMLGDFAAAEADLDAAVQKAESIAPFLSDPIRRASFLEATRRVFDEMVDLQAKQGQILSALVYADRSRGLYAPRPTAPGLEPSSLERRIPAGSALLAYRLLPDRLLIWGFSPGQTTWAEVVMDPTELESWVVALQQALRSDPLPQRASEAFYDRFIAPVGEILDGASDLVVVPDGPLHRVPFSALRDPDSQRYLAEDLLVVQSPSVAAALDVLQASDTEAFGLATTVLAVGNPKVESPLRLAALPHSEGEVRRISDRFPRTTVLMGADASEGRVLEAVRNNQILHVASHAFPNEESPFMGSLVLAPSEGHDGFLFAFEILNADLSEVRLAVLSACGSGAGDEGASSLPGAFLAAGVPVVVASLWELSDEGAGRFFDRFYQHLRDGLGVAEAVRAVQTEYIHSPDPELRHPAAWAPFATVRGATRKEP